MHDDGSFRFVHSADHPDTMNRCDVRLHDMLGWNMWSWRTKRLAYAQKFGMSDFV